MLNLINYSYIQVIERLCHLSLFTLRAPTVPYVIISPSTVSCSIRGLLQQRNCSNIVKAAPYFQVAFLGKDYK